MSICPNGAGDNKDVLTDASYDGVVQHGVVDFALVQSVNARHWTFFVVGFGDENQKPHSAVAHQPLRA